MERLSFSHDKRKKILPIIAVAATAFLVSPQSVAHDSMYTQEMNDFLGRLYKRLPGGEYTSCCSGQDCKIIDDGKTAWVDPETGVWKVRDDPKYFPRGNPKVVYDVTPQSMRVFQKNDDGSYTPAQNPSGEPVACIYRQEVRCFIKPPEM